ncbi:hypothetical protein [Lyngbya confervoides]|uniref:Uncharacterized protein n=1 Tax=Lyngbya confervoides BDU141951 TaxID=1574623 RepID=A0ABD4T0Z2_9CYAN|nr:hypothetical protein [Lyngbya confervoides]MCM1982030.1 hypothetical protein [Lyngbya confervoides BDU141951]
MKLDQSVDQTFIVREVNSLALKSLAIQSQYLYANVYRYWNYAHQLQSIVSTSTRLILYDLDCFTPACVIPLSFEKALNAPFPIPIVDTRLLDQYKSLSLEQSHEKIYDDICKEISDRIVIDLGLSSSQSRFVQCYLQKINLFQSIDFGFQKSIPLIIEANHRFYQYNLSIELLEEVVIKHLPISRLRQITKDHTEYKFILISHYTRLPGINEKIQEQCDNSLFIVDTKSSIFSEIWKQRCDEKFPLYGHQLDKISFFVKRAGQISEIMLPQKVCYEGEKEVTIYGQYKSDGLSTETFPLKFSKVELPFQINDAIFIDSQTNKEQAYLIENRFYQENSVLDVRIRFRFQPGFSPKLEVLDSQNRILKSSLVDRSLSLEVSDSLTFIPSCQISEFRKRKSAEAIQRLIHPDLASQFNRFIACANNIQQSSISTPEIEQTIINLKSAWTNCFRPNNNKFFILVFDKNQDLSPVIHAYNQLETKIKTLNSLVGPSSIPSLKQAYSTFIYILGGGYALTQDIDLDFLFCSETLSRPRKNSIAWDQKILAAAKVACTRHRQELFFKLFRMHTKYRNKHFFETNEYIWGYARLLLWYADIYSFISSKTYQENYTLLLHYCLSLNAKDNRNTSYLKDALISLIYMLTFRERDPQFVNKESQEYLDSKKLCQRLAETPILSRQANLDLPLNHVFENILEGSATQEQVRNMIEID